MFHPTKNISGEREKERKERKEAKVGADSTLVLRACPRYISLSVCYIERHIHSLDQRLDVMLATCMQCVRVLLPHRAATAAAFENSNFG